jgi:hypothetical protein
MSGSRVCWACLLSGAAAVLAASWDMAAESRQSAGPINLFNGNNLAGWTNVNGASGTWLVRDGCIVCTGKPPSFLRTEQAYENYVLDLEWRLAAKGGEAGLVVHAGALPEVGSAYPRAIGVAIKDGDHGSIMGLGGCTVTPLTEPRGSNEARPVEERCRPAGEWSHYQLTSKDGTVELSVNGKVVTRVKDCSQVKGYLGLQSAGSEVHFRNVRLRPLPSSEPAAKQVAQGDEGFRSLFDGVSFAGWQHHAENQGQWKARSGVIHCAEKVPVKRRQDRDLWTEKEYGDFVMVVDWRLPKTPEARMLPTFTSDGLFVRDGAGKVQRREILDAGDSGVFVRGNTRSQVNIWSQPMGSGDINDYHKDAKLPSAIRRACVPKKKADRPAGEWNRFLITMRGDRITVVLNGAMVIEQAELPGVPVRGRLGLQDHGDPVEFRNLFIKALD